MQAGDVLRTNREGRKPLGLWPEAHRTKIAKEMGVTVPAVSMWLNGSRTPSFEKGKRLSQLIGVNVTEYYERVKDCRHGGADV